MTAEEQLKVVGCVRQIVEATEKLLALVIAGTEQKELGEAIKNILMSQMEHPFRFGNLLPIDGKVPVSKEEPT